MMKMQKNPTSYSIACYFENLVNIERINDTTTTII